MLATSLAPLRAIPNPTTSMAPDFLFSAAAVSLKGKISFPYDLDLTRGAPAVELVGAGGRRTGTAGRFQAGDLIAFDSAMVEVVGVQEGDSVRAIARAMVDRLRMNAGGVTVTVDRIVPQIEGTSRFDSNARDGVPVPAASE
jgi:hypothetical protein